MAVIEELRRADPAAFAWRPPPYEYEHRLMPIDILAGSSRLRERIDAGEHGRGHRRVVARRRGAVPRAARAVPAL